MFGDCSTTALRGSTHLNADCSCPVESSFKTMTHSFGKSFDPTPMALPLGLAVGSSKALALATQLGKLSLELLDRRLLHASNVLHRRNHVNNFLVVGLEDHV